jgi:Cu+-exporting ATPase
MKGRKREPEHRDPVCGMAVSPSTAAATAEYRGKTYYFCAPGCRDEFRSQPERYVRGRAKV